MEDNSKTYFVCHNGYSDIKPHYGYYWQDQELSTGKTYTKLFEEATFEDFKEFLQINFNIEYQEIKE